MYKKYLAESLGTFALSFVVILAAGAVAAPLPVPVIAGLTLGLLVYIIGPVSGCHINPSVTIAQLAVKKISYKDASFYIASQLVGAVVALGFVKLFGVSFSAIPGEFAWKVFFAEAVGAFFFNFGIASVVYGKAKEQMSGFVVGGSLLLGVLFASLTGSLGILNPAVALALNALTPLYILAPVIGAITGFITYKYLVEE